MRRLGVLVVLGALGCTKAGLVDIAMRGAEHVPPTTLRVGGRLVLAGDMHCHVLPPDAPYHVSRTLPKTLAIAKAEGLDFVVLTPHVTRRFFADVEMREWVLRTQRELRERLAALHPELVVIPGFEYTDHRYGHLSMSFADPAAVLEGVTTEALRERPEGFFERWVASGGIITINHPVNQPLPNAPFAELRHDMSWRAFRGLPVPSEVRWVTEHAQAIETFNESVTYLRDQFMIGEEDRSLREAAHLVDRTARAQHRRIAAVGGTDSHGEWLRATTFVLATERSAPAIRDAIASGRTCVRAPEACTLQARVSSDAPWQGVGDELPSAGPIEVRASGGDVIYVVNGAIAATAPSGAPIILQVPPDRCSTIRAVVGRSWSSALYAGCGLVRIGVD